MNVKNDTNSKTSKRPRPGGECLLTQKELARALGESQRTILSWRTANIIPWIDCGFRSKRFRLDDVMKALEKRTIKAANVKG